MVDLVPQEISGPQLLDVLAHTVLVRELPSRPYGNKTEYRYIFSIRGEEVGIQCLMEIEQRDLKADLSGMSADKRATIIMIISHLNDVDIGYAAMAKHVRSKNLHKPVRGIPINGPTTV